MANLPWQNATQPAQPAQPNQGGGLPFGQQQNQQTQPQFGQQNQQAQYGPSFQQNSPDVPAQQTAQPQFGQQNQQAPDLAAQIAAAEVSKRGVWFDDGYYPCLAVSQILSRFSRNNAPLFIAEFEIIASNVESRRVGSKVTWMANFNKDAAAGNVKDFLAKLFNVTPEEVTPEASNWAMSAANPCQGRLIAATASTIVVKSTGNDFTVVDWAALPDEYQEQSEALRIQAGLPPNPPKQ